MPSQTVSAPRETVTQPAPLLAPRREAKQLGSYPLSLQSAARALWGDRLVGEESESA